MYEKMAGENIKLKKKIDKVINEIESDKMEQFDDYVIYLQEKYLDILKS